MRGNHDVGRALEFRAGVGDVGRRALGADPQAVGLGVLVVVVRADRQPLHRPGVTSSPAAFLGAFSAVRNGPVPENSLPSCRPLHGPDAVIRACRPGWRGSRSGRRRRSGCSCGWRCRRASCRPAPPCRAPVAFSTLLDFGLAGRPCARRSNVRPAGPCCRRRAPAGRAGRWRCSRSRGQPLDSKRQIVVCHSGGDVAVAVDEDDGRRSLRARARWRRPASTAAARPRARKMAASGHVRVVLQMKTPAAEAGGRGAVGGRRRCSGEDARGVLHALPTLRPGGAGYPRRSVSSCVSFLK